MWDWQGLNGWMVLTQDHKVKRSALKHPGLSSPEKETRNLFMAPNWACGGPSWLSGQKEKITSLQYQLRGHTEEMKWTRIVRHCLCNHSLMELHLASPVSVPDVHSSSRTRGNDALMTFENQQHGELLIGRKKVNLDIELQPRCNRKFTTSPKYPPSRKDRQKLSNPPHPPSLLPREKPKRVDYFSS